MNELSHLDPEGRAAMVDVGGKTPTQREAVATGRVRMSAATLALVERAALPKGDVLATARVAGILAAKATPSLVPLTHPLALTFIGIDLAIDRDLPGITVTATVRCEGKTGVEIEAIDYKAMLVEPEIPD